MKFFLEYKGRPLVLEIGVPIGYEFISEVFDWIPSRNYDLNLKLPEWWSRLPHEARMATIAYYGEDQPYEQKDKERVAPEEVIFGGGLDPIYFSTSPSIIPVL